MDVNRKVNVTLTIWQLVEVTTIMQLAKMQCERERESWAKLSLEKDPDGTPKFKNAVRNVECLDKKISEIEEIIRLLDGKTREEEQA